MRGPERQQEIYLGGVSGRKPRIPTDAVKLEEHAHKLLSEEAFAYIAGGAGAGRTMVANRDGFDAWHIVPRILRDVGERDTSIELLGKPQEFPFVLSPIGVLEMADPQADLAVARAARATGTPMTFSNQASKTMEECARELGEEATRFFQLYWSTSNDLVESFAGRAEACGCSAIAVTLDTTILGWRTHDLDLAYLPFLRGKGIAQYTSDPVFTRIISDAGEEIPDTPDPSPTPSAIKTLVELARAYPDRFDRALTSGKARAAVQAFVRVYSRPWLTWEDLGFLRERTSLPIVLKGILHPDDARRAVEEGMDGIWVSNHGGRQVDGAISTIAALPAIAEVVDGRIPIVMDSGIRTGADAFKAVALGATAVGLGRPYCYALAIAGEDGVREVIENFQADFDLTMGLSGCRSVAEIGPDSLVAA
ncbi:MAG: alpha-hydroxy-acid oxidizing protein [Thermoleophilaceae bacterium]|nr:alpha-hydroxy-acid oxidizing protein [Thermoleophilaceae bacterium]